MNALFGDLPTYPVELPADERLLLASLPIWDAVAQVGYLDEAACRRLEKRGLVKVHRWKDDPITIRPTLYAGKLDQRHGERRVNRSLPPVDWCCPGHDLRQADDRRKA